MKKFRLPNPTTMTGLPLLAACVRLTIANYPSCPPALIATSAFDLYEALDAEAAKRYPDGAA